MTEQLTEKFCKHCNQIRPIESFGRDRSRPDGIYPTCKDCKNAYGRAKYASNAEHVRYFRDRGLRRRYGLSIEQYEEMFIRQNGVCGLCGHEWDPNLFVDHDHDTGQIRQLLCDWCNKALGFVREDPDLLRKMADYLESYR